MIYLDRSNETILALCDCGARSELVSKHAAHVVDAWVIDHARAHEASRSRERAIYASRLRQRRHADGAQVDRKTSAPNERLQP